MFDNFSKVYVSVEDLAVRIMHADPDKLLFMFDERILIFLKNDSFYLPSVKTPKMAANQLKRPKFGVIRPKFRRFDRFSSVTVGHCGFWVLLFSDFRGIQLIVCFVVALRSMSTAMVIAGRSVHLTTFFLGRLEQAVNQ